MYEAIITPVVNVRPHPNADRIKLATACGYQVVVGLDTKEGTLGVFFPEGGQLSNKMCYYNNLNNDPELNVDKDEKGFFSKNRRVRAQNFRGQRSEGFWTTLDALKWTGVNTTRLSEGYTFTELKSKLVCQKYFSPRTIRAMAHQAKHGKAKVKSNYSALKEHYDTKKLRYKAGEIPEGSILFFTEKVHGTSGRTGNVMVATRPGGWRRRWNKWFWWTGAKFKSTKQYTYVTGTRKVVLPPNSTSDTGFYSGKTFRVDIHNKIVSMGLWEGETLFYEIVGYAEDGSAIMPAHTVEDKELKKQYGPLMPYSYGCTRDPDDESPNYRVVVYRITQQNSEGHETELSWTQVKTRCAQLGLEHATELDDPMIYHVKDTRMLMDHCLTLSEGPSKLDPAHIREGVCIRVEHHNLQTIMKYKSFAFCMLEGISANTDGFVDPEAVETYAEQEA